MSDCPPLNCPADQEMASDLFAASFHSWDKAACFSHADGAINIYRALKEINESIKLVIDNPDDNDTNLIHIHRDQVIISDEDTEYYHYIRSPFTYEVKGVGFSILEFPGSSYFNNDTIRIQACYYTNFTGTSMGAVPFGPIFELDKDHPQRSYVDDDIITLPIGMSVGFLVTRDSVTPGDTPFNNIDMFIKVKQL